MDTRPIQISRPLVHPIIPSRVLPSLHHYYTTTHTIAPGMLVEKAVFSSGRVSRPHEWITIGRSDPGVYTPGT